MNKKLMVSGLTAVFLVSSASCLVRPPVFYDPPPPKRYVRPPMPGQHYVWVKGHWDWRGNRWVWVNGYWLKKRSGYRWVPGHYERRGNRRVWVRGHWKRIR